jgi:hypothetical protein
VGILKEAVVDSAKARRGPLQGATPSGRGLPTKNNKWVDQILKIGVSSPCAKWPISALYDAFRQYTVRSLRMNSIRALWKNCVTRANLFQIQLLLRVLLAALFIGISVKATADMRAGDSVRGRILYQCSRACHSVDDKGSQSAFRPNSFQDVGLTNIFAIANCTRYNNWS